MSYPQQAFESDYSNQDHRWRDPRYSVPSQNQFPPSDPYSMTHNHHHAYVDHSAGWGNESGIVENEIVWHQNGYNDGCVQNHMCASQESHQHDARLSQDSYQQEPEYQAQQYHQESPAFEPYGHHGEHVSSPIEENIYQPHYDATGHYHPQATQMSHWVQQPLSRHGSMDTDTSVEVPDESRRRSLARYSDEIHASGYHGLESDKDCTFYSRRSPSYPTQPRNDNYAPPAPPVTSPSRDQSIANWNQQVTSQEPEAAYSSLAPSQSTRTPAPPMPPIVPPRLESALPQPHTTVPSQQPIVDYLEEQKRLSQSPNTNFTLPPASAAAQVPMSLPTSPPDTPFGHRTGSPLKYPLLPTPAATLQAQSRTTSSRNGLEHQVKQEKKIQPLPPLPIPPSHTVSPPSYNPGASQSVLKLTSARKPAEKKQALACLFCRERKIACGRPDPESDDQTCNQCARRHICCEYPKESRRGQHKRVRRKPTHDHDVNESSPLAAH